MVRMSVRLLIILKHVNEKCTRKTENSWHTQCLTNLPSDCFQNRHRNLPIIQIPF